MNAGSVRGNSGPQFSTLLSNGTSDGGTLHLALIVHDNTRIVLEVQEHTILSAKRLPLSDHNRWHNLFTEFWLTLLYRRHEHVTGCGRWKSIKTTFDAADSDDVKILGTTVVGTVHNSTHR